MKAERHLCVDCQEEFAALGRSICWNCKRKRHLKAHPETQAKINQKSVERYKTNENNHRTKRLKAAANYRKGREGEAAAVSRAWRAAHTDKVRAYNIAWQEKYPDYASLQKKVYALNNPEKIRFNNRLIKVHRANAEIGKISVDLWIEQLEYFQYHCAYCLEPLDVVTMDHMIPLSRGGSHDIGNVVPCCGKCNVIKYNKNLLEWFLYPHTRKFIGIGSPLPASKLGRPKKQAS